MSNNLCRSSIDALNERFSKFKPSPKIYVEEYQDLTRKLHELKTMEQNLIEKIQSLEAEVSSNVLDAGHFTNRLYFRLDGE